VRIDEATEALARTARAVPALANRALHSRIRRRVRYPDWMPILDEPPLGGLFIAAGMSGHGFKHARPSAR
jgi:glycine/D-amino acid oxidase-like deaminating enzyme